jgi:integrase
VGIGREPINANELLASGANGNEIDGRPWLLDCDEVSRLLGIGRTKAYQMMRRTEVPVVRIGRSVRVPRGALLSWISAKLAPGPGDEIREGLSRGRTGSDSRLLDMASEVQASTATGANADDAPWLLDSRNVSRLLGIGRSKAFQMMLRAELPVVRIGRCVRVPRSALAVWVSRQLAIRPEDELPPPPQRKRPPTQRQARGSLKRANGEGSLSRRPNGTWAATISLPKGRREVFYSKTRDDARRKLVRAVRARDSGMMAASNRSTVGDFLDYWLAEVVRPNVRPWTYAGYEVHVRLHLKPALGHLRLDKLMPIHVQQFLNQKIADGMKPRSVRYIRGTLRTALAKAVKWDLLSRNVAALVHGPRVERYEIRPLTPDEARVFLSSIKGDRLEALYSIALTMGLRQGEILGLRWQDIDLEVADLRVSKQLQRVDGKLQLVAPKTARSRRTLAVPASIVSSLREHRDRQEQEKTEEGNRWVETGLVFTNAQGNPIDASLVSKQFHQHLERAGLAQRRFHDLRHSCATLLLVQGVAPRVVMEVLGHSQIAMTMNTYSHVIPELQWEAARRMDALLKETAP